jgi:outer membrane protein assembly factor BamB
MNSIIKLILGSLLLLSACTPVSADSLASSATPASPTHPLITETPIHTAAKAPTGWVMFHADEAHSGEVAGTGKINPKTGPEILATYRLFDQPKTEDELTGLRWTSTLPLADLNGDGKLEIIVTTPDVGGTTLARLNGEPIPNMVQALAYSPGDSALKVLWTYKLDSPPGEAGIDTYSPALADADGDGLADVIFTARDGFVRALSGLTGKMIWRFNMGAITEAGPMLSDLDDNGKPEVVVVTDCKRGGVACPPDGPASLYVLPLSAAGENQALWSYDYPYKMDSAEPVIAYVHGIGKIILAGTWGGELLAVWRTSVGEVRSTALKLLDLGQIGSSEMPPVIRISPLVVYTKDGPLVIFGWLPSDLDVTNGRLTGVRLRAADGKLKVEPAWTLDSLDTWKSSPTLVTSADGTHLMAVGYGLGIGPAPTQSGTVGSCQAKYVFGGVAAVDESGKIVWNQSFGNEEGNLRASAAVADIDGDGRKEVVIPAGCYGKLHAFDALSGEPEWALQLGPRTQTSPSIADLDADGNLEIVIASYDGLVYVLGSR